MGVQLFDVVIRADARGMAQLLENLGNSKLVNVHPVREEGAGAVTTVASSKKPRNFAYHAGKRNKGITGKELAMQVLTSENRVFDASELSTAFSKHNFAGNSVWAVLSTLANEGKVRKLGDGKYIASGNTIHLGASVNG